MRKLILMGRSEAGKSTLIQALRHEEIHYHKTQYVDYTESIIDTPGEYIEAKQLGGALAVYSCEADVIGVLISATEPFCLFPPNVVGMCTRPVIGIVTKCDHEYANPRRAGGWLENCGCKRIFYTSSYNDDGIQEILDYLSLDEEPEDEYFVNRN